MPPVQASEPLSSKVAIAVDESNTEEQQLAPRPEVVEVGVGDKEGDEETFLDGGASAAVSAGAGGAKRPPTKGKDLSLLMRQKVANPSHTQNSSEEEGNYDENEH